MPIIVTDIDDTISDARWRQSKIVLNWNDFHAASKDDKPILPAIKFLQAAEQGFEIVACTGRNERFRNITMDWLAKYDVPIDRLLMRPNNDYSPAPELKIIMLEETIDMSDIMLVMDDDERVTAAFRERGIFALLATP